MPIPVWTSARASSFSRYSFRDWCLKPHETIVAPAKLSLGENLLRPSRLVDRVEFPGRWEDDVESRWRLNLGQPFRGLGWRYRERAPAIGQGYGTPDRSNGAASDPERNVVLHGVRVHDHPFEVVELTVVRGHGARQRCSEGAKSIVGSWTT